MKNPSGSVSGVRFGIFEADFEAGELRKRGLKVRLQWQPFRVLKLLLEQSGKVITREDLQRTLWPDNTFVDFDHGLNTAINKIRQALGDSATNPRFVETVHRRGYRFVAPVEKIWVTGKPAAIPAEAVKYGQSGASPAERPAEAPGSGESGRPVSSPDASYITHQAPGLVPENAALPSGEGREGTQRPSDPAEDEFPTPRQWLKIGALAVFAIVLALTIATVVMFFSTVQQRVLLFLRSEGPSAGLPVESPGGRSMWTQVRILAGSSKDYTDSRQQHWEADRFFLGGVASRRHNPVTGASNPNLYRSERYGRFQYVIPVAPGTYRLTLYFAETWFGPGEQGRGGPGSRIFDVQCNGIKLLSNFDVYYEAGGSNHAVERRFEGITANTQGNIVLTFLPHVDNAIVNAFELQRMRDGIDAGRSGSGRDPETPRLGEGPL